MSETILAGGCHCGALALRFITGKPLDSLPLLACQCRFCRTHGTSATADPAGRAELIQHDPARLNRYRFALKTADYLICRGCGGYIGALCAAADGERALINVNCLADGSGFARPARPVDYDNEDRATRLARRQTGWTPVLWPAAG